MGTIRIRTIGIGTSKSGTAWDDSNWLKEQKLNFERTSLIQQKFRNLKIVCIKMAEIMESFLFFLLRYLIVYFFDKFLYSTILNN